MQFRGTLGIVALVVSVPLPGAIASSEVVAASTSPLSQLFAQWRQFAVPPDATVPDYGPAAVGQRLSALKRWQKRLAALDRTGWSKAERIDAQLIAAEMAGMEFELRVLRPWARDPGFYANIWAEQSDVPGHEGPNAPVIDLFRFDYPLSPADAGRLGALLRTVPPMLAQARQTLKDGNARDLWAYAGRALHEQSDNLAQLEAGTLAMRTLEGTKTGTLAGASGATLIPAVRAARAATDAFAAWVAAEAPSKTGPSGVGKADYDWAMRNVHLLPYDWQAQETLLQRELDRAHASLRLEEVRNRDLPPLDPVNDPAAYRRLSVERARRFSDFLVRIGMVPDRPYNHAAIAAQTVPYTPPAQRNFFSQVTARDPLPLYSHFYHWIDLARLKHDPNPDPIRQGPLLFNIWMERSEGFATAVEEIAMQAGLYDDLPRGRELVWIMLANRAARGLASLHVQANQMTLAEAGAFHERWTPRGWAEAKSDLVGFEQLLYLRQPGYGSSYVTGKLQFDHLLARLSDRAQAEGRPFDAAEALQAMTRPGIIPVALIEDEMLAAPR
ncbi:DUF885 family protein [Sphingomonas sp. KR1UV-12]|uniref:DUF885 family protein n=1 Tax=Sphingomonas aurea TaxID=3063994 RepID=A0ABT9EJ63_9SPHN|nr:DUF885 family protein [Sphingomonas sp. KR1UV-12]MDP1026976.1 DUF885 family protein [Sphingomonas sp. KR1UV-12]